MWVKMVVEKFEEYVGLFAVACLLRNVAGNFELAFAGVYGTNVDCDSKLPWDELVRLISWWNLPWCIRGDFNIIYFLSERLGDFGSSPALLEFFESIFD
jgi:hypothetical protein